MCFDKYELYFTFIRLDLLQPPVCTSFTLRTLVLCALLCMMCTLLCRCAHYYARCAHLLFAMCTFTFLWCTLLYAMCTLLCYPRTYTFSNMHFTYPSCTLLWAIRTLLWAMCTFSAHQGWGVFEPIGRNETRASARWREKRKVCMTQQDGWIFTNNGEEERKSNRICTQEEYYRHIWFILETKVCWSLALVVVPPVHVNANLPAKGR